MSIERKIKSRILGCGILFFLLCAFFVYELFSVQFINNEKFIAQKEQYAKSKKVRFSRTDHLRGNIYSTNGEILALSIPTFELRFDYSVYRDKHPETFNEDLKKLCKKLSSFLKDKSSNQYYNYIINNGVKTGNRYLAIADNLNFDEIKTIRQFPIFNLGQNKGGVIINSKYKRAKPFPNLASRTIGYTLENGKIKVGIEGAFNQYISSQNKTLEYKDSEGREQISSENDSSPFDKKGLDVYTTLDVNIQDIAYNALIKQLYANKANNGCMVIMEVKTGEIKAIVNLTKKKNSDEYYEDFNYAISASNEPGSLMKLASYIVAIEDGIFDITDTIDAGKSGKYKFKNLEVTEASGKGFGKITMEEAFEFSSNIAIAKQIEKHYDSKSAKFVNRIRDLNLGKKLNIPLEGEGEPLVKDPKDPKWSDETNLWMSFGYQIEVTPLQMLTLYNAVANNGKMIAPKFVKEIRDADHVVKKIPTRVIAENITSKETLKKIKKLLRGVVVKGTARRINNDIIKLAGKTGTTQIFNTTLKKYYQHRASFCGYFPADNPKYSCIVVVSRPKAGYYTGAYVAAPAFKEAALNIYSLDPDISGNNDAHDKNIYNVNLDKVEDEMEEDEALVRLRNASSRIKRENSDSLGKSTIVPNVKGLGVSQAIYALSQAGIRPVISGEKIGKVVHQEFSPGSTIRTNSKMKMTIRQ